MANYFFRGTGGDTAWSSINNWYDDLSYTTKWPGPPNNTHDVIINNTAGVTDCVIDIAAQCKSISVGATYTNTIRFNAELQVSGSVTFGTACTIAGTLGKLTILSAGTLTSSAKTLTCGLKFNTAGIILLADTWAVNGNFECDGGAQVIGGQSISVGGNYSFDADQPAGTNFTVIMTGTGKSVGTTGKIMKSSLTLSGVTLTLNQFTFSGPIFTYSAGAITQANPITFSTNSTLTGANFNWPGGLIIGDGVTNTQLTLGSTITTTGPVTIPVNNNTVTISGNTLNVANGLTFSPGISGGSLTGATVINLTGGVLALPSTPSSTIGNPLTLSGTCTISGGFNYAGPTLIYATGAVTTNSTNTISSPSITLDTRGLDWNNLTITSPVVNIPTTSRVAGLTTFSNSSTVTTLTGSLFANGGLSVPNYTTGCIVGTGAIIVGGGALTGPSSLPTAVSGILQTNITTSGNISLAGNITVGANKIWTHTTGTVTPGTSSVYVYPSGYTFAINNTGLSFNNLTLATPTTFSGTQGCSINNLTSSTGANSLIHALSSGNTYDVSGNLVLSGTSSLPLTLKAMISGSAANFNHTGLNNTQSIRYVNPQDINSSGGRRIMTYSGNIYRSTNWESWTIDPGGAIYKALPNFMKTGYNYRLTIAGSKTTNTNLYITNGIITTSGLYGTIASGITSFNQQFSFTPISDNTLTLRLDKMNSTATLTTLLLEKI